MVEENKMRMISKTIVGVAGCLSVMGIGIATGSASVLWALIFVAFLIDAI